MAGKKMSSLRTRFAGETRVAMSSVLKKDFFVLKADEEESILLDLPDIVKKTQRTMNRWVKSLQNLPKFM
jgi:hypothetical protein